MVIAEPTMEPDLVLDHQTSNRRRSPKGNVIFQRLIFRENMLIFLLGDIYPPETNSSPLKMDGWKMNVLLGRPIFRGYVI